MKEEKRTPGVDIARTRIKGRDRDHRRALKCDPYHNPPGMVMDLVLLCLLSILLLVLAVVATRSIHTKRIRDRSGI